MKKGLICAAAGRALLLIWGIGIGLMLLLVLIMDVRGMFDTTDTAVQFPCRVPGTSLTVERIAVYDGAFVEDGSDREVTNVTAALLRNDASQPLAGAEIQVHGAERMLCFRADMIPAGATVLVLEKDAAPYMQTPYTACTGWAEMGKNDGLTPQQLRLEAVDMGTLRVTNLTAAPLRQITLYYKTRPPEDGIFLGGITYQTVIELLEPNQPVCIRPYHYAGGYSQILKAVAE